MEIDPLDFSDSPQDFIVPVDVKELLLWKLEKDLLTICEVQVFNHKSHFKLSTEKLYLFLNDKFCLL